MADPRTTLKRMQIADQRWKVAIEESAFAAPDDGFADRLRLIASAAKAESDALYEAAGSPQLRWNPIPDGDRPKRLSYELRPGGNRPGPGELWDVFDEAVGEIASAQAGTDFTRIADGYRALADVSAQLASAVDDERGVGDGRTGKRQAG